MGWKRRGFAGAVLGAAGLVHFAQWPPTYGEGYPDPPEEVTQSAAVEFAEEYERAYFRENSPSATMTLEGRVVLDLPRGFLVRVGGGGSVPAGDGAHGDIFVTSWYYVGNRRVVTRIPMEWESRPRDTSGPDLVFFAIAPGEGRSTAGEGQQGEVEATIVAEPVPYQGEGPPPEEWTVTAPWDAGRGLSRPFLGDVDRLETRVRVDGSSYSFSYEEHTGLESLSSYDRVIFCLEPGGDIGIGIP